MITTTPSTICSSLRISHPIRHLQRSPLFIRRHIPTRRTNPLGLLISRSLHGNIPRIMHSIDLIIRLDTIMQPFIRLIIVYRSTITHMTVIDIPTPHVLRHPTAIVCHRQNRIYIFFIIHHRSIRFSANSRLGIYNNRIHRIRNIPIIGCCPAYHLIKTGSIKSMRKLCAGSPCHQHTINIPTVLEIPATHRSTLHIRYRSFYRLHHHSTIYLTRFQIYGCHGKRCDGIPRQTECRSPPNHPVSSCFPFFRQSLADRILYQYIINIPAIRYRITASNIGRSLTPYLKKSRCTTCSSGNCTSIQCRRSNVYPNRIGTFLSKHTNGFPLKIVICSRFPIAINQRICRLSFQFNRIQIPLIPDRYIIHSSYRSACRTLNSKRNIRTDCCQSGNSSRIQINST